MFGRRLATPLPSRRAGRDSSSRPASTGFRPTRLFFSMRSTRAQSRCRTTRSSETAAEAIRRTVHDTGAPWRMRGAGPPKRLAMVFPATRTYVDRLTGEHLPCLWTPTALLQSTPDRRPGGLRRRGLFARACNGPAFRSSGSRRSLDGPVVRAVPRGRDTRSGAFMSPTLLRR